jgi:oxygen-dependent protoporphyrinogen oxidase
MTAAVATQQKEPPTHTQVKRHVVIVGGGISGLSAAWYLQQQADNSGMAVSFTVLEASDRWGGKILTEQVEGFTEAPFVVEAGPDSFLTQKPWALQLARELGLAERLLGANDRMRNVYVLHRGKPVVLPDGVLLIVPTRFLPFALSPLISPLGKLRMALDLFIPPKRDDRDETLAEFVRRQLEREHGSLIRGMLASRRQRTAATSPGSQMTKTSMFISLQGGTQELVDALVKHIRGDLRLYTRAAAVERLTEGSYRVTTSSGDTLYADAVLLTTPAYVAADLLRPLASEAAGKLATIRYVSTGTVSMAFRATHIKRPLYGFGLVVPKSEQRPISAITISSTKFNHRAPDGYVLLRVFFGGSRSPETMTYDDDQLLSVVHQELRDMLGIEAAPLFHRIYRWHQANPQYDVNHLERIAEIEAGLPAGVYVTGSAIRGVGLPDCVYQAQQTVNKIMEQLKQIAFEESEPV